MAQWVGQVGASADDAKQVAGGTMTIDDSIISLTAGTHWVGFRFTNITIPKGAAVSSAYLSIYIGGSRDDPGGIVIYGVPWAYSLAFTTDNGNISGRPMTSASVTWTGNNIGTGAFKDSPNISSIIQELLDWVTWESGKDAALLLDATASTALDIRAYDGYPSDAAILTINYTVPSLVMARRPRTYVRM